MSTKSEYNSAHFEANLILRGKIECLTGLHIGGSKEKLEIGGVDSPVMRHPHTKFPFIPGSSLKGKMRHLLEYSLHVVGIKGDVSDEPKIVRIFGSGADNEKKVKEIGPSRLIVRDCTPDIATIKMWKDLDSELLYTEYKPENTINRLTSEANPRFIERVVSGSKFNFEMIYTIYRFEEITSDNEKDEEALKIQDDINRIFQSMRLLESNFLGKSGSRGYGQVCFHLAAPIIVTQNDYVLGNENYKRAVDVKEPSVMKPLSETTFNYISTMKK